MTTVLRTSHSETGSGPAHREPAVRRMPRLGRAVSFWTVGLTVATLLAASSAPSPLYAVYQSEFGFSATTLTTIFAVYVVALLGSLLVAGRLSDHVGRRPVLAGALVVETAAMLVFLGANDVGWLIAARIVQGFATGAAIGVLGAYLLDLQPPDGSRLGSLVNSVAPTAGLGIGALGTGLLVQYAPAPTRLVFAILAGLFVVLFALTALLPETVSRTPGAVASMRPQVAVPPRARTAFAAATPTMVSTWALGGLVLSVGGSIIGSVFGQSNYAVIGLLLGIFAGSGSLAALLARNVPPATMSRLGTVGLVIGVALFVTGVAATSLSTFVVASVLSGAGFGAGFLGSLRAITQLAEPHQRAALLSAVYVVSYLAFSIPAYVAGLITTHEGLRDTALGYGGFVGLVGVVALGVDVLLARRAAPDAA